MGKIGDRYGGGIGPLQLFAETAAATSESSAAVYNLERPCRYFGLQVITPTSSAIVTLQGSLSSAIEDSTGLLTTLVAWSSGVSGAVVSTESTAPYSYITASLDGAATSEALSAWFTATP